MKYEVKAELASARGGLSLSREVHGVSMIRNVQMVISTLCLLSGCDVYHEKLVGPYIIDAVDSEEAMNVAYDDGSGLFSYRMGPTVTDVGWDERYITAAVRPEGRPRGAPPVFYYLDIARDSRHPPDGGQYYAVVGPLSKAEFDAAKTSLKLPEFKRHFPKLR